MKQYKKLIEKILLTGEFREDRTGIGTYGLMAPQVRFDLRGSFPLLTLRKIWWNGVVGELLWFLSGSGSIEALREEFGVTFWDQWEQKKFYNIPIYGEQWRQFNGCYDQVKALVHNLKNNPFSRRHVVTAWNPEDVAWMDNHSVVAPPPCHLMWQCRVSQDMDLDMHVLMRSCDVFIGLPYNIASYALLQTMIGQIVGMKPRELTITMVDCHIYKNHLDACEQILTRAERPAPRLYIDPGIKDIDDFSFDHIKLEGYDPHPNIKVEVAN